MKVVKKWKKYDIVADKEGNWGLSFRKIIDGKRWIRPLVYYCKEENEYFPIKSGSINDIFFHLIDAEKDIKLAIECGDKEILKFNQ
jgi:hypothetical protein